jgi:ubiquinone biosynthesis protein COQ4
MNPHEATTISLATVHTPSAAPAHLDGASELDREIDATELPARERWKRAFAALGQVLRDPEKTDQVLVFSTYANAGSMKQRIHRFLDDPRGRRLFEEHRTIDARSIDLAALARLPEGTLGRAYADFLNARGLTPDVFENPPDNVRDPAIAYVVMRLRQTHDLWHVVTGYDTDPASEVALQAFTFGQLGAPSAGILAVLGTLRAMRLKPGLAADVARAFRLGRRAEHLAIFPWEDHWAKPLVEVRALLGLPAIPHDAERLGREVRAALAAIPPALATMAMPATTPSMSPETASSPQTTAERHTELSAQKLVAVVHGPARVRQARRAARRAIRAARRAAA